LRLDVFGFAVIISAGVGIKGVADELCFLLVRRLSNHLNDLGLQSVSETSVACLMFALLLLAFETGHSS
jgi:hypothetical protein